MTKAEMDVWLELHTDWREALHQAETIQDKLDSLIKHHYDGLGDMPTETEVINAAMKWEVEFHARNKLFGFISLKLGLINTTIDTDSLPHFVELPKRRIDPNN